MSAPPQIRWFFFFLKDKCKKFAKKNDIKEIIRELPTVDWALNASSVLINPAAYSAITKKIFKVSKKNDPVITLQNNGYFGRAPADFFSKITSFDQEKIIPLLECLMWAYLDHKLPKKKFTRVIGRLKTNQCSDADSLICQWINTISLKYGRLAKITTISHHFLGLPHYRLVLFNSLHDPGLRDINDTAENNATIALAAADDLKIPSFFDASDYHQPPLVIMCYLCGAIKRIAKYQKKHIYSARSISALDFNRVQIGINNTKTEVNQLTARVHILQNDVNLYTTTIINQDRAKSARVARRPGSSRRKRRNDPDTARRPQSPDLKRVKWAMPEGEEDVMIEGQEGEEN